MLEEFIKSPVTRRRLNEGPAGPHILGFAQWLRRRGYTPVSIQCILRSLAAWTDWMVKQGYPLEDAPEALEACAAQLQAAPRKHYARGPNRVSLSAARNFLRYLRHRDILPTPRPPITLAQRWPTIAAFRDWMRQHRGLADSTLDLYQEVIADLLEALGDDPQTYTPLQLRAFVTRRVQPHGIWRAKGIVVSIRTYLRFLGASGRAPLGLEHALPTFSARPLAALPKYIEPQDLQRVIDACDPEAPGRLRDRAVVLLLARLGLRASEVANLCLEHIDWNQGRIAVSGKNHRTEWLPLPQDVGDALLAWLRDQRPPIAHPCVFTTVTAPHRPLSRAAVTHIVRAAFRRAGVTSPVNGAHALRHSAATAMLREGASLAGVGAVLRHRAPGTTALYAKVDFALLSEIAQPWPEETAC
jgi:integrase/recombinase XerD